MVTLLQLDDERVETANAGEPLERVIGGVTT